MSRVALLGATGTIGRATAQALVDAGHDVVAIVRREPAVPLTVRGGLTGACGPFSQPKGLVRVTQACSKPTRPKPRRAKRGRRGLAARSGVTAVSSL